MRATFVAALAASSVRGATIEPRAAASAWCTSSDRRYLLSSFDAPVLGGGNSAGLDAWDFSIKEQTGKKQTIHGFGAAVTDSTVTAFNSLPSDKRSQLLRDLMTPDGINFNLMRHTVASSDLSGPPAYSYDDNGGNADTGFSAFNLGDRGTAMAQMLAEMRGLQPNLNIVGSPWAPPGWMQLDGVLTGTTEQNNLNHAYVDSYAQYFVRYLQAYENLGAHIDAITIQNEPLNSKSQFPTMYIYESESGALIRDNVGPALRNAGLDTNIWAFDHNTDDYSYPQTVFNMASDYVNAVAWHCYSGIEPEHWEALNRFHDDSSFTLYPLQRWANGIIAWALGTYTGGGPVLPGGEPCSVCTGIITVDAGAGTYTKTIDYYNMGQFSKFMPKGATVLDGTGSYEWPDRTGLEHVSTLNPDGTRTVVIQNLYDHDIFVRVKTESESQTWNGRVYAQSLVTWVLPAA